MFQAVTHKWGLPFALFKSLSRKYGGVQAESFFRVPDNSGRWWFTLLNGPWIGYAVVLHNWQNDSSKGFSFELVEGGSEAAARKNAGEGRFLCRVLVIGNKNCYNDPEFKYSDYDGRYLLEHYYPLMREVQDMARQMLEQLGLTIKPSQLVAA